MAASTARYPGARTPRALRLVRLPSRVSGALQHAARASWPGASLRSRLTAAFFSIIVVTLLLAGTGFVFILREYQANLELNRIAELTIPLANQARSLELLGTEQPELQAFLQRQADELDLQIILADARGTIFFDTENILTGQRLQLRTAQRFGLQRRVRQATVDGPNGSVDFMIAPAVAAGAASQPGATPPDRPRAEGYLLGVAIPHHSLASAWLELLPRLSLAALVALALSVGIAWLLAASIARPLARMTRAAEEIAQGRLDQQIAVEGRDEIARLARAFNHMAREVQASQRTLKDFLANVSHDLRTPLTSIQGFSQALTDGTLRDRVDIVEAGRIVHEEAARMSRLVDDLLYLSRIESGQAPLEKQPLDLAALVGGRIEAALPRAREAGVTLHWRVEATPTILGDRHALERVVDNLLNNALRHTPSSGVVTVRLHTVANPHLLTTPSLGVILAVHNTGSYIPPDDLPRVFERFYQVDKARAAGGSGLGLAISREIVQAHGGRCWAASSPETGTEFFVLLPAQTAGQAPTLDHQAPKPSTSRPETALYP